MALIRRLPNASVALLAVAAGATVGASACETASPATRAPTARPADAAMVVDTATVETPRAYPAQIYVERDVAVAARASGVLDSLYVNLGTSVRADAPLAVVESRAQEIALARARERLERAQSTMQRTSSLAKSGGATGTESEQAAGELRQAELNAQQAEHDLALTRVSAPFAGVVTARYVRPRQLVSPGDTLFRVAETGPQLVRVRVGEPAARSVVIGDHAAVRATGSSGTAPATVIFTAPALEPASGTREVILRLGAERFLIGEAVTVEMGHERRVAVVAPRRAIAPDGYALVAQGDRTTMRPVTIGATLAGDRIEIVSGLTPGEHLAPLKR